MCLSPKCTRPRAFKAGLAYSIRLRTKLISVVERWKPVEAFLVSPWVVPKSSVSYSGCPITYLALPKDMGFTRADR